MTDQSLPTTAPFHRILVANRAEIACRVLRASAELGIETVAVGPADDAQCLHLEVADQQVELPGRGAGAYLDADAIIAAAQAAKCDAIHPGYGFLSENADFAAACKEAGIAFIGPAPEALSELGDKTRALRLADRVDVPTSTRSAVLADGDAAADFVAANGPTMLKAAHGGGGRGMRSVRPGEDVGAAFERCQSESLSAFGSSDVYAESLIEPARHIEIQVVGDGNAVMSLHERECSLQRRRQKIVEYAPAPNLSSELRSGLSEAAVRLASAVQLVGLATIEFLVGPDDEFVFMEANPRVQVEHTVTEEVTGVDLVQTQIRLAAGASLADVGLTEAPTVVGQAVQVRINTERMQADGEVSPTGGTLDRFALPTGPGIRIETHAYAGYTTSPAYDSLLAKVIVHARRPNEAASFDAALTRMALALEALDVHGVETNREFIQALLADADVRSNRISTDFVDRRGADFVEQAARAQQSAHTGDDSPDRAAVAGASIDRSDPLAVLALGRTSVDADVASAPSVDDGHVSIDAPLQGTVISISADVGQRVEAGDELLVMEAMKMEHVITASHAGRVNAVTIAVGDAVFEGHRLVVMEADRDAAVERVSSVSVHDLDVIRPDLAEVNERHAFGYDENRLERVAKRHGSGKRTARENLADLIDPGSMIEYGPLTVAAQRKRRSLEDLIRQTPGDGLIGGIASVNGEQFGDAAQTMVVTYDYMVLAGTQGHQNHRKKDRLFELARQRTLPVILFGEGGGGRPGDTDGVQVAGLDCLAFNLFAELSGSVPLIGINGGYSFAGNAALLGCCDVVIATKDSNVGMGGPAMIEGGGLGVFHPSEVGPLDVQRTNGVVDIVADDEADAVRVAKQYLSYFQGDVPDWEVADQRRLRHVIPENRLRIYDVREVIEDLFDTGSVLELRRDFGLGMITALARIEGRAVGVLANNPVHLAGAIDSDGADKASRFMQLCEAFGLPIVSLCDTPGIMVGPEAERTGLVRHAARMFVTGANLTVPMCTIVLRKGYGLGAQAMAGGGFKAPIFTVAWPTSEFGGMGLEGAVKLGYRNELAAIEDPAERLAEFEARVARMYEVGKGVSMADHFEIDDVIDPVETRRWITTAFRGEPAARPGRGTRPFIDTW